MDDFKPDVIGLRTLTLFRDFFHNTVARIREWGFAGPVVTGGPYASSDYKTILQDPNIDLAVLGEGEITFSELLGKIIENGGKIPGKEILEEIAGIAFIRGKNGAKKKDSWSQDQLNRLDEKEREEMLSQFIDDLENE
jgi:radical SAM superfamily enzyme YgiQ (UPF0313 family)